MGTVGAAKGDRAGGGADEGRFGNTVADGKGSKYTRYP